MGIGQTACVAPSGEAQETPDSGKELRIQLHRARHELAVSRTQIKVLESDYGELVEQYAQLEKLHAVQLRNIHQDLATAQAEIADLLAQNQRQQQQSEATISDLQAALNAANLQLASLDIDRASLEQLRHDCQAGQLREQDLQRQLLDAQRLAEAAASERQALDQHARAERSRLEAELEAVEQLLDELPTIFESKFEQRLQHVLEQRSLLLQENAQLKHLLQSVAPAIRATSRAPQLQLPGLPARTQRSWRLFNFWGRATPQPGVSPEDRPDSPDEQLPTSA